MYILGIVLFVLLSSASVAEAACSGSGLTWTCTAGSTSTQVRTAITSASNEAVITFLAGSYSWGNLSLEGKDGLTLICETEGGCDVSGGMLFIEDVPTTRTNLIRISGFDFSGSVGNARIWMYGNNHLEKIRIDHNTFTQAGSTVAILFGESSSSGKLWAVVDHNTFFGANNFTGVFVMGGGASATWPTGKIGTGENIFAEDNVFNFTTNSDLSKGGMDAWKSSIGVVFRYNTMTNSRYVNHSLCHGGPPNSEVYGNTINSPTGSPPNYRNLHFQGAGELLAFNNIVGATGSSGHIALQHYRSDSAQMPQGECTSSFVCDGFTTTAPWIDGNRSPTVTYKGYPCWRQPGRDASATLKPVYLWNNRNQSGTKVAVSLESNTTGEMSAFHVKVNRDYYEAPSASAQTSPTSPFNGTSGMGFGTLANRPTTCTTGSDAADAGNGGVGYFATDVGSQGTLYRCSATNTWIVHYTPYTYPHPLQFSDTIRPIALTDLGRNEL